MEYENSAPFPMVTARVRNLTIPLGSTATGTMRLVSASTKATPPTVYASRDPAPGVGRWVRINYAITLV